MERLSTETNIAWAQSEGECLVKEITEIQKALSKLQTRLAVVRRFEELERGILQSPIRTLPVEILRHIFILAHGGEQFLAHDLNALPRALTRVCWTWRSVAYSCAPLWTSFVFTETNNRIDTTAKGLEDYLRFSNRLPLSFLVRGPLSGKGLECDSIQPLAHSAYRWENVVIEDPFFTHAIFRRMPAETSFEHLHYLHLPDLHDVLHIHAAPKLRKLEFTAPSAKSYGYYYERNVNRTAQLTIRAAPSLSHICMRDISCATVVINGINALQITQFESYDVKYDIDELFRVLQLMPNLISLSFCGEADTMTESHITLNHLETLKIAGSYDDDAMGIFTTPRLKKLDVLGRITSSQITVFAQRSVFTLEEFLLSDENIDMNYTATEFDSVKTFYWDYPDRFDTGVNLLVFKNNPPMEDIFLGLEHLHISNISHRYLSKIPHLIDMLKSRLRPKEEEIFASSYLKSVHIGFRFNLEEQEAFILADFIQSDVVKASGVHMTIADKQLLRLTTGKES